MGRRRSGGRGRDARGVGARLQRRRSFLCFPFASRETTAHAWAGYECREFRLMTAEGICAELDRLKSSGQSLESLLASAVRMLHESNPRFHWTGIYELFPDGVL